MHFSFTNTQKSLVSKGRISQTFTATPFLDFRTIPWSRTDFLTPFCQVYWTQKLRKSSSFPITLNSLLFYFFFFFTPHLFFFPTLYSMGDILVPQPGVEATPPAVAALHLNHWTAMEFPFFPYFF